MIKIQGVLILGLLFLVLLISIFLVSKINSPRLEEDSPLYYIHLKSTWHQESSHQQVQSANWGEKRVKLDTIAESPDAASPPVDENNNIFNPVDEKNNPEPNTKMLTRRRGTVETVEQLKYRLLWISLLSLSLESSANQKFQKSFLQISWYNSFLNYFEGTVTPDGRQKRQS